MRWKGMEEMERNGSILWVGPRIALITDPPSFSLSLSSSLSRFEQDLNGRLSRHSISRLYLWIIGGERESERPRKKGKKREREKERGEDLAANVIQERGGDIGDWNEERNSERRHIPRKKCFQVN